MVESSPTRILLQSLSGATTEVHIAQNAIAHDLKVEVFSLLSIPVAFQILIANNRQLEDSEVLANCALVNNGTLSVTAIMSMDSISSAIASLNSGTTKQVQLDTLENLTMLGPRYLDDVIIAVGSLLNAEDPDIKLAAWTSMTKIAERGNQAAMKSVIEQLEHASSRQEVIMALGKLADIGDDYAISELSLYVDHPDVDLCVFALEALEKFAGKGHRGAILAVIDCLCDGEDAIRWKAVEVLQQIVAKGDQRVIAHVRALRNHPHRGVRWAAVEAVGQLCDA